MADTVTTQIIQDGERNCIMKFTNVSDGTGESAVVKVDVSALQSNPSGIAILAVYQIMQGVVRMETFYLPLKITLQETLILLF
jgi:hypothetical protein